MQDKPFYPHDCKQCVFLGLYVEDEGTDGEIPYDLYYYPQVHSIPTVVARYGEAGGDYMSGLVPISAHPVLQEAARRAKERGLA